MERWSGKTAVVSGASTGIGAALCVRLANHGIRVVGLARRAQLVNKLASEVKGKGIITSRQCDVSKPEEIAETFKWIEEQFGGVDILVNNAGVLIYGHISDAGNKKLSDDEVMSVLDINVKGLVLSTRHAIASMKKRNFNGHIVNVSSIAGHYVPFDPNFNVYSASKHAVTTFTSALVNEMGAFKTPIKVTNLSPGLVRTDMVSSFIGDQPGLEPRDVADAILYVLSTPPHVNISELTVQPVIEKRF